MPPAFRSELATPSPASLEGSTLHHGQAEQTSKAHGSLGFLGRERGPGRGLNMWENEGRHSHLLPHLFRYEERHW